MLALSVSIAEIVGDELVVRRGFRVVENLSELFEVRRAQQMIDVGEGGLGVLAQPRNILQNAFFVFEFAVFAGLQIESFDFLALEGPEVGEAELFLLSPRDFVEFAVTVFPGAKDNGDGVLGGLRGGEIVENAALGSGVIELLLLVLAVDVAEPGRDLFEQGGGDGAAGGEGAGFAVGEDFAFDEEFVFFEGDAGFFEQGANGGGFGEVENAADAGAVRAGADEIGRGSAAEEEAKGIDDDRLAAARFAGKEVETVVEAQTEALNDGEIFDVEFDQHERIVP